MPFFNFHNIKISAIASSVPTQKCAITDFADVFGEEYCEKFSQSTGIREFRKSLKSQTASDFCYIAANNIIQSFNVDTKSIGALVFVAHSTDYRRPATACVLHKRLGLDKNCAAFDINLGCSAFVYGLNVVCSMLACSNINKALLLVGETLTKMTNPKDKSVAMLFGDGGSAILLEKTNENSIIQGLLKTDGTGYKTIIAPAGGFRQIDAPHEDKQWPDGNIRNLYNTFMKGEDVFSFTISDVPRTIKEFLTITNTTIDSYDCFAFHQANQFIHKQLCKKLKISPDKMPICLDRYGNTSAPAIPMVLCDKYGSENNPQTINTLLCGFGVGLSWGVCSARISTSSILPIIETDEIYYEGIINGPEDF